MLNIISKSNSKLKIIPPSTAYMTLICAILLMNRYSDMITKGNFLYEILFAVFIGLITAFILLLVDSTLYKKKLKKDLEQLVKENKE